VALGNRDLDKLNTTFLDTDITGLESYELFDLEGRIVRPITKLNTITNDTFSNDAKQFYQSGDKINQTFARLRGDEIQIAKSINAYQVQTGQTIPVGIIAIKFKPLSLQQEAANNSYAYLKSLIITCIVGVFFFGFIYFMTSRPILEMKFQIEEALRGKRKELESKLLMSELYPLRGSINSILHRIRELQNDENTDFQEIEEDGRYIQILQNFIKGSGVPSLILNSEKLIVTLNSQGEDLTGLRESVSAGESLLDTARDQGFAATVIDLCDQSANNEGCNQSENYEIGGREHQIHVTSLIGKDGFAKAFYITFVEDS
jgi:PAS domain-containing protein